MNSIILHDFEVRNALKNDVIQIRRPIKPPPENPLVDGFGQRPHEVGTEQWHERIGQLWGYRRACPFGQPGDRLWVKETWCEYYYVDTSGYTHYDKSTVYYAADGEPDFTIYDADGFVLDDQRIKWRSSVHMPSRAYRLTIVPEEIWVEKVQDITEDDAKAEGLDFRSYFYKDGNDTRYIESNLPAEYGVTFRNSFAGLWDFLYFKKGFGWEENLPVWAGKFKVVERK